MITIEQVIELDDKITAAAKLITSLKTEKKMLSNEVEHYKKKVFELEKIISELNRDEGSIEKGFNDAMTALDNIVSTENKTSETKIEDVKPVQNNYVPQQNTTEEDKNSSSFTKEESISENIDLAENNNSPQEIYNSERKDENDFINETLPNTDEFIDLDETEEEEEIEIF